MNKIQKIALIVFTSSFTYFFLDATLLGADLKALWSRNSYVFLHNQGIETLALSLSVGSLLGFFLFKDSKKEDE